MKFEITDTAEFIKQHSCSPVSLGKSGADIYCVDDSMILKYCRRENVESGLWKSFVNEILCCKWFKEIKPDFAAEVLYCRCSEDETVLLMKKYRMLRHEEAGRFRYKIMNALASIHHMDIPAFLPPAEEVPFYMDNPSKKESVYGWKSVLTECGIPLENNEIAGLSDDINGINLKAGKGRRVFTHGDFHCDNILVDSSGNIKICDWQNVSDGDPAGDLSFFLSRLEADGINADEEEIVSAYCREYSLISGFAPDRNEILRSMRLSNLNTSFLFWHRYLHGSTGKRVLEVYHKMLDDYHWLKDQVN